MQKQPRVAADHHNCVVHFQEILDGLGQWLPHVGRHELEHFALPARAKNQAEPDEQQQDDATEGLSWQLSLTDAEENGDRVVSWIVDA
jgi:hypothetical protein